MVGAGIGHRCGVGHRSGHGGGHGGAVNAAVVHNEAEHVRAQHIGGKGGLGRRGVGQGGGAARGLGHDHPAVGELVAVGVGAVGTVQGDGAAHSDVLVGAGIGNGFGIGRGGADGGGGCLAVQLAVVHNERGHKGAGHIGAERGFRRGARRQHGRAAGGLGNEGPLVGEEVVVGVGATGAVQGHGVVQLHALGQAGMGHGGRVGGGGGNHHHRRQAVGFAVVHNQNGGVGAHHVGRESGVR